jgi:hypothetical protein
MSPERAILLAIWKELRSGPRAGQLARITALVASALGLDPPEPGAPCG